MYAKKKASSTLLAIIVTFILAVALCATVVSLGFNEYFKGDRGERGPAGESIIGPQGEPGQNGQDGESIVGPQGPQGESGEGFVQLVWVDYAPWMPDVEVGVTMQVPFSSLNRVPVLNEKFVIYVNENKAPNYDVYWVEVRCTSFPASDQVVITVTNVLARVNGHDGLNMLNFKDVGSRAHIFGDIEVGATANITISQLTRAPLYTDFLVCNIANIDYSEYRLGLVSVSAIYSAHCIVTVMFLFN